MIISNLMLSMDDHISKLFGYIADTLKDLICAKNDKVLYQDIRKVTAVSGLLDGSRV